MSERATLPNIQRAAVLGAGTMGSGIAALLAGAGVDVDLFDLDDRAREGLTAATKRKPDPFYAAEDLQRITPRSLERDLEHLRPSHLIIEAVAEDLEIKRALFQRVDEARAADSIVCSNTSGISIRSLAEGLSESFQSSFLGMHFFNPPRAMKLVELIPTPKTDPNVLGRVDRFATERLGKGVIRCQDTPLFVANRVGIFARLRAIQAMMEHELTIPQVDAILGPAVGRPKTAVFRLGDLVGLDVTANVARYLYRADPADEMRDVFRLPSFIETQLERGLLGDKTGRGFYWKEKVGKETVIKALDWRTGDYGVAPTPDVPTVDAALAIADPAERLRFVLSQEDPVGRFAWTVIGASIGYAARRLPTIARSPADVDRALRWGFNWELGLFEIVDALGWEIVTRRLDAAGVELPEWWETARRAGRATIYQMDRDVPTVLDIPSASDAPLVDPEKEIDLGRLKSRRGRLAGNDDASLIDLGHGVAVVEFHSKMNTLGPGVVDVLESALERLGRGIDGLVIGNNAANFSAGANLRRLLNLARAGEWKTLDRRLQTGCVRLGRSTHPIVSAPAGLTLGGGAEIVLRSTRALAHVDLAMGLVETRVGLIPAAGGTTEMLRRATRAASEQADPWPAVKNVFDLLRSAKTSTSARHAIQLGYLRSTDQVIANRSLQLSSAKKLVLSLLESGVTPPCAATQIWALGKDAYAKMSLELHLAREAGAITEYDQVIGEKLARVLSGGDVLAPRLIPEDDFLDLEREAFLSLLGDERTQSRIEKRLDGK